MKSNFRKIIAVLCIAAVLASSPAVLMAASAANCSHTWALQSIKEAKCWANGTAEYKCTKCGETKKEIIYSEGHKWVNCKLYTEDEAFHVSHCERCGSFMYESHEWNTPATGGKCIYCNCAYSAARVDDGHSPKGVDPSIAYKDEDVGEPETPDTCAHSFKAEIVEPKCWANGYTNYTCTKCGYSYKDNVVATTGHEWSDEKLYDYDDAFHTNFCAKCGSYQYEEHVWDKAAEGGKCTLCGCEYKASRVANGREPYFKDTNPKPGTDKSGTDKPGTDKPEPEKEKDFSTVSFPVAVFNFLVSLFKSIFKGLDFGLFDAIGSLIKK